MPHVRMRDGKDLYVRVIGRGEPVLLLPGLGMQSWHWLPWVLPLASRYRFHLPDYRGFGRSSHLRVTNPDVFQSHADDVHDVITQLGLNDFPLGGISLGGTTALHLLKTYGFDRVRSYLHIDQSPCVGNRADWAHGLFGAQQAERYEQLNAALLVLDRHPEAKRLSDLDGATRRDLAQVMSVVMAAMSGKDAARLRTLLLSPAARFMPLSNLDTIRVYLRAYLSGGHDYRAALAGCTTPITLMVGMHSALYEPAGQLAIAALAKDVTVIRFDDSGHVPLLDEPVKFVRELGRWLRRSSREEAPARVFDSQAA